MIFCLSIIMPKYLVLETSFYVMFKILDWDCRKIRTVNWCCWKRDVIYDDNTYIWSLKTVSTPGWQKKGHCCIPCLNLSAMYNVIHYKYPPLIAYKKMTEFSLKKVIVFDNWQFEQFLAFNPKCNILCYARFIYRLF